MGKTNQSTGPVESLTTEGEEGQIPVATAFGGLLMGSGTDVDVQEFTSSGTWTKPDGAVLMVVYIVSGGGGGGGGVAGDFGDGGAGGGGGGSVLQIFTEDVFSDSETIQIGAGGSGGAEDGGNGSSGGLPR